MPLNRTLKNGYNDKFYIMYIFLQFKKQKHKRTSFEYCTSIVWSTYAICSPRDFVHWIYGVQFLN